MNAPSPTDDYNIQRVARAAVLEFVKSEAFGEAMSKAVDNALERFGVDTSDPTKQRRDMVHLRNWAETMEVVRKTGIRAAVQTIVLGSISTFMVGLGYVLWNKPPH